MRSLAVLLGMSCLLSPALADWRGEAGLEGRWHWQSPLDPAQRDAGLSLSLLGEYYRDWDGGAQRFTFKPFLRLDQSDPERTHLDVREAAWLRVGDGWELRLGIDKVFWGVTEAWHLVDVINQTDLLENPDGEEKLGQPMVKLSLEREWGVVDAFLLPWFRERPFPGEHGRLRSQPRVDTDRAVYDTDLEQHYPSVALRWSRSFDSFDLGVAHFHGTSREPRFSVGLSGGTPVLIPHYDIIDQTSVDLQAPLGDWLWKFEALHRSGQGDSYAATTGGFEYTFVGIADSNADLGVLLELMLDGRGDSASSPFNHDVFVGLRWVANDVDGSEVLGGVVLDWEHGSRFLNLEASRRLGSNWKASLQARAWQNIDSGDAAYTLRRDDYVEARLIRYF